MCTYAPIKKIFFATIVSIISSSALSMPITFNFTGTISDEVLSNGSIRKSTSIIPKWIGKQVSGSITMDLDSVIPEWSNATQTYYRSHQENGDLGEWMTVTINNPDGTSYTIAPPIDPLPAVDVSSASTYLTYNTTHHDQIAFFAGRNYANLKKPPRQEFYMWLSAEYENASKLLNTTDFDTVNINTDFANWTNYGVVYYIKENGKKMNYEFTFDSFTRAITHVPEPGSLFLVILGLGGLFLTRSIKRGNSSLM